MSPDDADPGPDRVKARIDLHCHSAYSKDAIGTLQEIADAARAKGLDGVCITDHDTLAHHPAIDVWNRIHDAGTFRLFAGCEVTTREGHLLAFGLREAVPRGLPVAEAVDAIRDQAGVCIPAHPLRRFTGIGVEGLAVASARVPAVEVWNAQDLGGRNAHTATWAVENGKGGTGGSDAHQVHDVGHGVTEFLEPVDDLEGLLKALETGHTWGVGRKTALATLVRQATRNTWRRATGRL